MERLINVLVSDICERLTKVKKELLENDLDRNLNKRELAKLYFSFTTSLDEGIDDVEGSRLTRAMFSYHKTGDYTIWDYGYKYKMTGLPAALILYLRYYASREFNVLSYNDLTFMNKIGRTLIKFSARYLCDENINVSKFKEKLDQISDRAKYFYGRGWIK